MILKSLARVLKYTLSTFETVNSFTYNCSSVTTLLVVSHQLQQLFVFREWHIVCEKWCRDPPHDGTTVARPNARQLEKSSCNLDE